jgi:alpha-L-rhamnosidase
VEAWINGVPTSDELFNPGWTAYEWRTRLVEHDVTDLLHTDSALALRVGNGWYRGYLGFTEQRAVYGDERAAWAELDIVFADGHRQRIVTDTSWRSSTGAVVADDFYRGQTIDARIDDFAWMLPHFDDSAWHGVRPLPFEERRLVERTSPPVRRLGTRAAERIWTSPSGKTLVDFGQNLVGFVAVAVRGERGSAVTLRHAEVLEDGDLATGPLRSATSTDTFILSGADDAFEPTLTFHGFRYAEVDGWPGTPALADLTAVVVGSDIPITGTFSCSNPELNRLHANVIWGMRGNFLSVPTDCPQRDERLGWTGDIAVFAPTAAYLADVEPFLTDWLTDLALEQRDAGTVPVVVPNVMKHLDTGFPEPGATAVWGDAAIWVPWALWSAYGHIETLADAYPSMAAHLDSVETLLTDGLWVGGFQFGDWLDPDAPADDPGKSKADPDVVATACAYRDAAIMAEVAAVLKRAEDAERFSSLRDRIGEAFRSAYISGGRIRSDCATVYALAIEFGIVTEEEAIRAGDRLAEIVEADGHRISTGFAGTPSLLHALTSTGHLDTAYRVLLNPDIPGWLHPVRMGATTIWERWDSQHADGRVNSNGMTSFNHYAFGAVADWMHRAIGGLSPLEPGYRTALIAPRPGGGITHASTSTVTPFGELSVRWSLVDGSLEVAVTVPPGTTAVVRLPGQPDEVVGQGSRSFHATPLPV